MQRPVVHPDVDISTIARDAPAMQRDFMCCSYTISGILPGGPKASRHPLHARLAACKAAGYRGYWLHFRDYLEQREAGVSDGEMRDLFARYGLIAAGVEFLTDWFLDDPAASVAEAAAFDAANAIGASVINVGADFLARGIPRGRMIERFAALCGRAAERGLSIALEIVPWSNVPDVGVALLFLDPPNAGLVIDSWHIFRGGSSLSDIASVPFERILCVQVDDATEKPVGPLEDDTRNRLFCGDGVFDLAGFAGAIDACGARVPFSVEIISPAVAAMSPGEAARRSFETARRTFAARA